MRRVLTPDAFRAWFDAFLPDLAAGEPRSLFTPAFVSDRSDGKIAHLDGVNLSAAPGAGAGSPRRSTRISPRSPAAPPTPISTPACRTSRATIWASIGSRPSPCWRWKETIAMNHLYLQLGRAIAGQCPPGFQQARLDGGAGPGRGCDSPARWRTAARSRRLCRKTRRTRSGPRSRRSATTMAKQEGRRWRRCTVTLVAGGGFGMEVDY